MKQNGIDLGLLNDNAASGFRLFRTLCSFFITRNHQTRAFIDRCLMAEGMTCFMVGTQCLDNAPEVLRHIINPFSEKGILWEARSISKLMMPRFLASLGHQPP